MKKLTVTTLQKSYDILIGEGLLDRAGEELAARHGKCRAVIVSDDRVAGLYADRVLSSLARAGFEASLVTFPAGEEQKRLSTVAGFYAAFAKAGLTRGDLAVALGGGVTGDMCGFAAATYLRGIEFMQIPTSLLAQVDSSVGGKTGVDLDEGKNLVGAFWQPLLVLCDPAVLSTLTDGFFADGMAEAIKAGCIRDSALFSRMEREDARAFLPEMIGRCIDIKRRVVEKDERESGERMLLNFGHTVGHAIERIREYRGIGHGEAVAIGMVAAAKAGEAAGLTAPGTAGRIAAVCGKYGLPVSPPYSPEQLAAACMTDKKRAGQSVNFVLLRGIGESFIHPVGMDEIADFLRRGEGFAE